MNSKGQVFFFTFMLAIVTIILALAFAPVLKTFINDARDSNSLDCTNSSISVYDQSACLVADISLFGFIVGLIAIAGAVIGARVVFAE